jgi:hypothetical protein
MQSANPMFSFFYNNDKELSKVFLLLYILTNSEIKYALYVFFLIIVAHDIFNNEIS